MLLPSFTNQLKQNNNKTHMLPAKSNFQDVKRKINHIQCRTRAFLQSGRIHDLVKRIQHFQLDQYGVVIIKCPPSVTIEHKKKMIPLLEKIHLNEYQRQKNKFVVEDVYSLSRIWKETKEDPEYIKKSHLQCFFYRFTHMEHVTYINTSWLGPDRR